MKSLYRGALGALLLFGACVLAPSSASAQQAYPGLQKRTLALASSLVVKGSPGQLFSFEVQADSTLSAAAWWIMIYNATAVPADGAVTPFKCYAISSGTPQAGGTFGAGGIAFSSGIVIAVSTAGCFTQTSSAHAFLAGDFN